MKKLITLLSLFPLILLSCVKENKKRPQTIIRPNIVWIVAEDLSPILPPYGDSTVTTPNISQLAAEGVTYDNAFSPSGVCAPSRAAIATGCYPIRIGANHMRTGPWFGKGYPDHLFEQYRERMKAHGSNIYQALPPPGVKMMSEVLRNHGYYTTNNSKQDYQMRVGTMAWDETSNKAHWRNRSDKNQPFFSVFNMEVTHESKVWKHSKDTLLVDKNLNVPVPPYLPSTQIALNDIRRVYSNIKLMDQQVGEIINQLREDSLLNNTIIWYYSDHGGPLPRQKRLVYDSGLKIPLIIKYPDNHLSNTRNNELVSFIDFAPTVMSQAQIKPQIDMDGRAFDGVYKTPTPRQYIHAAGDRFDENTDQIRAVRNGKYKYIEYRATSTSMFLPVVYRENMPIMRELHRLRDSKKLDDNQLLWFRSTKPKEEFFDVVADPHEINNLADDPNFQDIKHELRNELHNWLDSFEDLNSLPETELLSRLLPNGLIPITDIKTQIHNKTLTISSYTEGASIGFRVKENKAETWTIYTKPITLKPDQTIECITHRLGFEPSSIKTIEYSD